MIKKVLAVLSFGLTVTAAPAFATSRAESACAAGEHATIYTSPTEPVATCATDALTAYSNFILGLATLRAMTGQTGPKDPNALEASQQGETAVMVQNLRKASGVGSAKEALNACSLPKAGTKVIIIEVSATSTNAKVSQVKGNGVFWIPTNFLDK